MLPTGGNGNRTCGRCTACLPSESKYANMVRATCPWKVGSIS
jgi:hypothetical protein